METWRLLDTGARSAAENMALDETLLELKAAGRITPRIEDLYRRLGEAASLGLRHLGIRATFRPRNDIEIQGRKISGTGGTELSGAILFQGTVLVDFDVDEIGRAH